MYVPHNIQRQSQLHTTPLFVIPYSLPYHYVVNLVARVALVTLVTLATLVTLVTLVIRYRSVVDGRHFNALGTQILSTYST
jgi:hypothetical protein